MKRSLTAADADSSVSKRPKTDVDPLPQTGTESSDSAMKTANDMNANSKLIPEAGKEQSTASLENDSSSTNSEKEKSGWDFWAKKKPTSKFSGGVFSQDDLNNMFKGGSVFEKSSAITPTASFLGSSWPDNGFKIVKSKDQEEGKSKVCFTGEVDPGDRGDEVMSEWSEIKVYELCVENISQHEKSSREKEQQLWGNIGSSDKDSGEKNKKVEGSLKENSESSKKHEGEPEKNDEGAEGQKTAKKSKWVERGEGCLKVTKYTSDGKTRFRMICRRSQTLQVLVNETITELTEFTRSGNFIRVASPTSTGDVKFFLLKPLKAKLPPLLKFLMRTKLNTTVAK